jgi:hypothetical protein
VYRRPLVAVAQNVIAPSRRAPATSGTTMAERTRSARMAARWARPTAIDRSQASVARGTTTGSPVASAAATGWLGWSRGGA